jgi:hypothetical protein
LMCRVQEGTERKGRGRAEGIDEAPIAPLTAYYPRARKPAQPGRGGPVRDARAALFVQLPHRRGLASCELG